MTADSPAVSVVLPIFNSEEYLRACVESVLNQSYADFELVAVVEPQQDVCLAILNSFGDKRLRVIQNAERLGLSESLNRGIRDAVGRYIARIDADDTMHRDRLMQQVSYLEAHQDIAVVGSQVVLVDDKHATRGIVSPSGIILSSFSCDRPGNVITDSGSLQPMHPVETVLWLVLGQVPLMHPSVTFRKDIVAEIGNYDSSLVGCEDVDLWYRLVLAGHKMVNLPTALTFYREHKEQGTRTMEYSYILNLRLKVFTRFMRQLVGASVRIDDLRNYCSYVTFPAVRNNVDIHWRCYSVLDAVCRTVSQIYQESEFRMILFRFFRRTFHTSLFKSIEVYLAERIPAVVNSARATPVLFATGRSRIWLEEFIEDLGVGSISVISSYNELNEFSDATVLIADFHNHLEAMADIGEMFPELYTINLFEPFLNESISPVRPCNDNIDERIKQVAFLEGFVKYRLSTVRRLGNGRIAIYGAGRHTEWMNKMLHEDGLDFPIAAILDETPRNCDLFGHTRAVHPTSWQYEAGDIIILSTDTMGAVLEAKCREFYGKDAIIFDIYSGLPIGPYLKEVIQAPGK